jgi:outer membrane protein
MFMKKICSIVFIILGFSSSFLSADAQKVTDSLPPDLTLQVVVQYALKHYPLVQQALIDEQITDRQIKSKLSEWYPQVALNANYQNNIQLQDVDFNGSYVSSSTYNQSTVGLSATQNLFNRDVLLASQTRRDVITQSKQNTVSDKIDITVNVSKAFYNVLLTEQDIKVSEDDIVRLERNLKDTYNQYRGGLVDKTDYKRATISLNNAKAQKKTEEEALKANYAQLVQLMGYTGKDSVHLSYDSTSMEGEVGWIRWPASITIKGSSISS